MNASEPREPGRWGKFVPAGYSAVLTLLIMGPLLGPGYLLLRDAVSTPRSYLTGSALGLGDAAPRAVPQDAMLAVLSPLLDGGLIVKAILLLALWAAGYGAAVLVRELLHAPVPAQLVASTVALWNPYLAERLLQGHWSLLTGYAALPWIILAANRIRVPMRCGPAPGTSVGWFAALRNWAGLAGALAAAGLTPTGAVLGAVTALVVVGRRRFAGVAVLVALASVPWLLATAVSGSGSEPSDPAGIAAFAARAEPGLGTLGSLAGLGGIWNGDAVPATRTTLLALIGTLLLLAIVATGLRSVWTAQGNRYVLRALVVVAALAILLPALGATPWGMHLLEWLVAHVPGTGLLRDTQKYVALAVPAYALCAAASCTLLAARCHSARNEQSPGTTAAQRIPSGASPSTLDPERAEGAPATTDAISPVSAPTPPASAATTSTSTATAQGSTCTATTSDTGTTAPEADTATAEDAASHAGTAGSDGIARTATTPDTIGQSLRGRDDPLLSDTPPPVDAADHATASAASSRVATPHTTPGRALTRTVAGVFIVLLVLPLLDLAWGVGGALRPVHYPAGWGEVAERVDGPGDVAVLPGGMFRKFRYSGTVAVLDPAPRLLPRDVLQTGELPVRGRTVAGEGTRARTVEGLLLHGGSAAELAGQGVGWVLLERGTPGPLGESKTTLAQLDQVYTDTDLTLYRVPGPIDERTGSPSNRLLVIAAHLLWAALLLGGVLLAVLARTLAPRPLHLRTRASRS
nr:hypothetical protein [Nocardia brasiliensis]